jgi:hypothetical protein
VMTLTDRISEIRLLMFSQSDKAKPAFRDKILSLHDAETSIYDCA